MNNLYLSSKAYTNSCNSLFFQPFREGISNLKVSGNQNLSISSQFKHLVVGVSLIIPVINTLVQLLLRKTLKPTKSSLIEKKVVVQPAEGKSEAKVFKNSLSSADKQLPKSAEKAPVMVIDQKQAGHSKKIPVKPFTPEASYQKAWQEYKYANGRKSNEKLALWDFLPPENLILQMVDSPAGIEEIPLRLMRDAALAYKGVRWRCLNEERLWNLFTGYIEYRQDILACDSELASAYIFSKHPKELLQENLHSLIIESAFPAILKALDEGTMTLEQMRSLTYFLIIYRQVVSKRMYEIVVKIEQKITEPKNSEKADLYAQFLQLIRLVVEKYNLQGIVSSTQDDTRRVMFTDNLFSELLFDTEWENIAQHFTDEARHDSSFTRKATYFSLLSEVSNKSPYFAKSRKILGNIARAQGDVELAESYFTQSEANP